MSKLTIAGALRTLEASGTDFARLLERETFDVGLYKPDKIDPQGPHVRDEVYVIASGSGFFEHKGVTEAVAAGDVLFVPAGDPHRFRDFTDDFSAWVVFFGHRANPAEAAS